jgi:hypothetical protein
MAENSPSITITELERQLLRALCNGLSSHDDWNQVASQLSSHLWREPDHKVVYEALRAIKSNDPKTRRDELPAQVTRMGFPDLDCSVYFAGEESSTFEVDGLMRQLNARTS